MARLSELEKFLTDHIAEGRRDSSGKFTLSREKALEKLSAYQLPRPSAWVLKIVQGVVASGAKNLVIKQTATDTEFFFTPANSWTLEAVAEACFDPTSSEDRGLDQLKRGLWSISLNDMHPFRIALPGFDQALIWTGQDLQQAACPPSAEVVLTVSHRTCFETAKASAMNAAVLCELTEHAYVCPIPLMVDGRRLDAFQACPSHGLSKTSYPVQLGFAGGSPPYLPLPQGTFAKYEHDEALPELRELLAEPVWRSQVSAAWLLTAHLGYVGQGKGRYWTAMPRLSLVYWVLDGVVLEQEFLDLPKSSMACALFLTAEGLELDVSGFSLVKNEARRQRLVQAIKASQPRIAEASFSFEDFLAQSKKGNLKVAIASFVGGGLLLTTAHPVPAFWLIFLGLSKLPSAAVRQVASAQTIEADHRTFIENWKRFEGQTLVYGDEQEE